MVIEPKCKTRKLLELNRGGLYDLWLVHDFSKTTPKKQFIKKQIYKPSFIKIKEEATLWEKILQSMCQTNIKIQQTQC